MTIDPKRILVLGGTAFLGRAVVEAALGTGHEVTLFNRGQTNPELYPEAEKLRGDRNSDLSVLQGRSWDAVIDVACQLPESAELAARTLSDEVERYVFVSTVSVYARNDTVEAQREDAAVLSLANTDPADEGELYGARKATCETIIQQRFGERSTIGRPGLIVGAHDRSDRFGYWPRRLAAGGRVLAPGSPQDHVQFIDVRDLGDWLVLAATSELPGVFNLTGLPLAFGDLLEACKLPDVPAEIVWVPSDELLAAGAVPWTGLPLWVPGDDYAAFMDIDTSRAIAAGLRARPLSETVAAAREDAIVGPHTLTSAQEEELLARLS